MHAKDWFCIGSSFLLGACSVSGDDAASRWVQSRTPLVPPANSLVVPTLVDTPPAVYTAKHFVDPFAPGRIGQPFTSGNDSQAVIEERWHFADAPVDSLRVVGFLEVKGRYVGVIEGSAGSLNVKAGDRLGNRQAEIIEISKQGIRLRQTDGSESWMPIARRSR